MNYIKQLEEDNEKLRNLLSVSQLELDKSNKTIKDMKKKVKIFVVHLEDNHGEHISHLFMSLGPALHTSSIFLQNFMCNESNFSIEIERHVVSHNIIINSTQTLFWITGAEDEGIEYNDTGAASFPKFMNEVKRCVKKYNEIHKASRT